MDPGELFVRGMYSAKMSGGVHGWTPPTPEEMAHLFPNYEILSMLGRGGMGAVYKARQLALDRFVAIKLLPLEISVDPAFADRFRREARAMAKLNHPNIIAVHDFGTTDEGHLFFAMEFVEGANLHDIIQKVGLDSDQALSIAAQVCTALAYAHGKGVVHRDIKPANVMIDTESHVKVADFGLARLTDASAADSGFTGTGTVMGTPDYMSPEQKRGMNVDHRADIYSVGVMLYEMLCRETPQGAFAPPSLRTGCDTRIDGIVLKAMQQAPDHRYQSTGEMKADVETVRTPPPAAPPPTTLPQTIPAPALKKKPRQALWTAAAALVALAGAGAFIASHRKKDEGGATTPDPGAAANPVQTFAGHRYQFIYGGVTWPEAKVKAEALGGHLATLTTKAESDWALATFGHHLSSGRGVSRAWIGALKNTQAEPWQWVTGEPFGFAEWFAKLNDPESARPGAQGPFAGALTAAGKSGVGRWSVSKTSQKAVVGFLVEWDSPEPAPPPPPPPKTPPTLIPGAEGAKAIS